MSCAAMRVFKTCLSAKSNMTTVSVKSQKGSIFGGSLVTTDRLCGLVVRVLGYRSEARVRFPALTEKKKN
jgi:small nuclear ribonucleoprotein (snRNP)-like protein